MLVVHACFEVLLYILHIFFTPENQRDITCDFNVMR